ncbi:MAG: ABC transporter substrate-binding protein [bacterium]
MKRSIIVIIIITIVVFAVVIYWQTNNNDESNKIRLGYNVESVNQAPIIVAYEKGYFSDQGLDVELVPLKSKETREALSIGQIDLGSAGASNFFIPISVGAPVKIIAPLTNAAAFVFVDPASQIKTLKNLENTSIASRIGTSSNFMLRQVLIEKQINTENIEFLDIEKAYRAIALMEKDVADAAVGGEYEVQDYLDSGAIILPEWEEKGYSQRQFPRTSLGVNTDFLNKNPYLVDRFIDALILSQKFIHDNQNASAEIVANHINNESEGAASFSKEEILITWKSTSYPLWTDPNEIVAMSVIAKEIGDIDKSLIIEEIFDLRYQSKLNLENEKLLVE